MHESAYTLNDIHHSSPNEDPALFSIVPERISDIPLVHSLDSRYIAIEGIANRKTLQADELVTSLSHSEEIISQLDGEKTQLEIDNLAKNRLISEIIELNRRDSMTGLLNSEAWNKEIDNRIENGQAFGLWSMDVRFFKLVNDTYGHSRGDALLVDLSYVLKEAFQRSDDRLIGSPLIGGNHEASRTGGDEFGLTTVIEGNQKRSSDILTRFTSTTSYVNEIIQTFVTKFPEDIRQLGVTVAVGEALWDPENPVDRKTLLQMADDSMYKHKAEQLAPLSKAQLEALDQAQHILERANVDPSHLTRYNSGYKTDS
jgi:diguanylate cyclase (GGDEF)-like protein